MRWLFLTLVMAGRWAFGDGEEVGVPVRVSVNIGGSAVPYDHKGGAVDEEDVRRFCRERLKAHLSLGDTSALGLLENLWPSCRKTLLAELPRAIEEADDALFRLSSSRTPKPLREVLENPSGAKVNAKHLVGMLPLSRRDKDGAMRGFTQGMWEVAEGVLSPFECDEIIEWARPLLSKEFDSVDEAPSFQADLPLDMTPIDSIFPGYREASAFVRCYSKESRPRLPFHVDSSCKRSASLNLSPSESYDGGDLLLFADRDLVRGSRKQGCATIHDANIAHAISDMKKGERWSLVMFQYE